MKKLSKKEQKLNLVIVLVAVGLIGASVAYYFRKNNKKVSEDTDKISEIKEPINQVATVENNTSSEQNFSEVNNTWFTENPFAFAAVDTLNVRDRPGQNGRVIMQAKKGDFIGTHTGKSTDIGWPTDPGRWAKIELPQNGIGWVFSGMIESRKERSLNGVNNKLLVFA